MDIAIIAIIILSIFGLIVTALLIFYEIMLTDRWTKMRARRIAVKSLSDATLVDQLRLRGYEVSVTENNTDRKCAEAYRALYAPTEEELRRQQALDALYKGI